MRIKVVDVFSDGDLECLATTCDGDEWIRVSRYNLCGAIGNVYATDDEVKDKLLGKEFDITPIIYKIIPTFPKLASENRWTYHEIRCDWCGRNYCTCGDKYKPLGETLYGSK